jgi:hypothetical protein
MQSVGDVQLSVVTRAAASVATPVHTEPSHRASTVGLGGPYVPATDNTVQLLTAEHEIVPGSVGTTPPGYPIGSTDQVVPFHRSTSAGGATAPVQ